MRKFHMLKTLLILATLYSVEAPASVRAEPRPAAARPLTFVYLHGFGGVKKSPKFCENFREFVAEERASAEVVNYEWDSVEVDLLRAAASWIKAQKMADAEAPRYKRQVIDRLEREGRPYVLVGYSVGARVIMGALESSTAELKHLRGIYFLGAAMTKDRTLKNRVALPRGMKITNYHSPYRDMVHRMAFNFISESPGGGQVGFDDTGLFENYPVSCSHAHKGVGIAVDYSGMAEAIAFLELYRAGQIINGRTKANWETPVRAGEIWWNRLMTVRVTDRSGRPVEIDFEQHSMRPGYYRALRIGGGGDRTRVARGENLHAILAKLEVAPGGSR
ncbi:MAG: hypothetical protein ACR2RV_04550 [Verrucomicrobiales bacterium]